METVKKDYLGLYNPFGSIVDETISAKIFDEALEYFFELEKIPNQRRSTTTVLKNPRNRKVISKELFSQYVDSLRTWQHELTHFYQINSCPLGIFLFKAILAKRVAFQRLLIGLLKTDWINSGNSFYLPIPAWYQWLKKNQPQDEITNILYEILIVWQNSSTFEATIFGDRFTDIYDAIDDVERLLDITSGMFDKYFDIPSGLTIPKISTHLGQYASVPTPYCTTLRIIEGYAKLIELKFVLSVLKIDEEQMISRGEFIDPIYYGVQNYILSIYNDVDIDTMLGIMDLSLFTPIDSLFYDFWSEKFIWEDIYPGYRLRKIASLANEKSLRVKEGKYFGIL